MTDVVDTKPAEAKKVPPEVEDEDSGDESAPEASAAGGMHVVWSSRSEASSEMDCRRGDQEEKEEEEA